MDKDKAANWLLSLLPRAVVPSVKALVVPVASITGWESAKAGDTVTAVITAVATVIIYAAVNLADKWYHKKYPDAK